MKTILFTLTLSFMFCLTASAQQNFALDGTASASASSTANANFPASAVIDGDRTGYQWGAGGGWNDATRGAFPDSLTVTLARPYSIGRVTLVTLQDAFNAPTEPTPTQTCAVYGVKDFTVEVLTPTGWQQTAAVTGNSLCVREVSFAPVRGMAVRLTVTASHDGLYSRIVEAEVHSR
ncbi:MAG: discoidin domain-containing protein [Pyrinomonadaceae bacterium]